MTTDPTGGGPRPAPAPAATRPVEPQWEAHKDLRPTPAAAGAGLLVVLTWTVWSTTASRLSLFLCVAAITVLATDLVWSQVASGRVVLRVTGNPSDAVIGDTVGLSLSVTGPRQFVRLSVLSLPAPNGPLGIDVPATERVTGVAQTRQVMSEVFVEVVSQGLSGMVGCARRQPVPLARPLAVGPRVVPVHEPFPELSPVHGEGGPRPAATGDIVRGVRPYVAGDPPRRVHWRTSARAGELMVKEIEDFGAPRLILVLNLGNGGAAAERAAGRAAWWATEALRRDYDVILATAEGNRLIVSPVRSWIDVNRRLAAASPPGQPKVAADGTAAGVLLITPQGDSWH